MVSKQKESRLRRMAAFRKSTIDHSRSEAPCGEESIAQFSALLQWLKSGFGLEFFHHTLNQLFGVGEILHNELHVHDRFARPTLALAVDAMLSDEGHRVGDQIHGDSEASAGHAHALFEVLELFLLFVEDGHAEIVAGMWV